MEHQQKLEILLTFFYERNFLLTLSLCNFILKEFFILKNNCHIMNVFCEVSI